MKLIDIKQTGKKFATHMIENSNVFIIIQLNSLNIKSSAMAVTIPLHTNGYGILTILVNTFYKENTLFRKNNKN